MLQSILPNQLLIIYAILIYDFILSQSLDFFLFYMLTDLLPCNLYAKAIRRATPFWSCHHHNKKLEIKGFNQICICMFQGCNKMLSYNIHTNKQHHTAKYLI